MQCKLDADSWKVSDRRWRGEVNHRGAEVTRNGRNKPSLEFKKCSIPKTFKKFHNSRAGAWHFASPSKTSLCCPVLQDLLLGGSIHKHHSKHFSAQSLQPTVLYIAVPLLHGAVRWLNQQKHCCHKLTVHFGQQMQNSEPTRDKKLKTV